MKKILILTASFGDGHNAAARSLRDAIVLLDGKASVEVLDVFESTYGILNTVMKRGYQGVVRYAPALWAKMFGIFSNPKLFRRQMDSMGKLRRTLAELFEKSKPDVVISTYPVYAHAIADLFQNGTRRPFRLITVITDSISVCSAWYLAPSDLFIVANEPTADVLLEAGVSPEWVRVLGFPVSPVFGQQRGATLSASKVAARPKLLYVINTGKAQTGKSLDRLLKLDHVELTITAGRNASLKAKLTHRLREYGHRVRILGWTDQMPQLLMSHHLLISKAGGAMVQEAIAACCPMIINQVIPGQEEGNAQLIESLGVGAVVTRQKDAAALVQDAFADHGRRWGNWRDNLQKLSLPDSAIRIAELVLDGCGAAGNESSSRMALSAIPVAS
jgi:UDP-N-acetylglucosamine:LPS N-acetylglucosamine transferase